MPAAAEGNKTHTGGIKPAPKIAAFLTFNQHHCLQIHGTAMGTKMAPSFANLFLGIFETNALSNRLLFILTIISIVKLVIRLLVQQYIAPIIHHNTDGRSLNT